jgi:hypothetical protein
MTEPRFDPSILHGVAATTGANLADTADALVSLEARGLVRFKRRRGVIVGVQPITPPEYRAEVIAEGFDPDPEPVTGASFGLGRQP